MIDKKGVYHMKRAQLLKFVNPLLALGFIWVAGTAVLHSVSHELIPFEIYVKIHPIGGYVFTVLVIAHVILNWAWIKANFLKRSGRNWPLYAQNVRKSGTAIMNGSVLNRFPLIHCLHTVIAQIALPSILVIYKNLMFGTNGKENIST